MPPAPTAPARRGLGDRSCPASCTSRSPRRCRSRCCCPRSSRCSVSSPRCSCSVSAIRPPPTTAGPRPRRRLADADEYSDDDDDTSTTTNTSSTPCPGRRARAGRLGRRRTADRRADPTKVDPPSRWRRGTTSARPLPADDHSRFMAQPARRRAADGPRAARRPTAPDGRGTAKSRPRDSTSLIDDLPMPPTEALVSRSGSPTTAFTSTRNSGSPAARPPGAAAHEPRKPTLATTTRWFASAPSKPERAIEPARTPMTSRKRRSNGRHSRVDPRRRVQLRPALDARATSRTAPPR